MPLPPSRYRGYRKGREPLNCNIKKKKNDLTNKNSIKKKILYEFCMLNVK